MLSLQTKFLKRLLGDVLCLTEVIGSEGIGINDDDRVLLEIAHTDLQCCGVHSHKDVGSFPRGAYCTRANLYLIARDTTECTLWRPYLGREVREGRDGVPRHGGKIRENCPRQLHTITRVSRETDDDVFERFDRFLFVHSCLYVVYVSLQHEPELP